MIIRLKFLGLLLSAFTIVSVQAQKSKKATTNVLIPGKVWSAEKANAWYKEQKWITGANYIPATAINQLEMWQADTFDPGTIDKELGWAQRIGFNTMRVFLHSIAWQTDSAGFKKRMNDYLAIADKHAIKTMFVFFDDCWNKEPKPGKQSEPKPGIHNSGWMQDPGHRESYDSANFPKLERYVKDVLTSFGKDKRILLWDLYNEPGNNGKKDSSYYLLNKVFQWARAVNPDQPISVGLWSWDFEKLNELQLTNSDVITYHNYEEPQWHKRVIELLKASGRPLICTEYMARTRNSRFSNTLPLLKEKKTWELLTGVLLKEKQIPFTPGTLRYQMVVSLLNGFMIFSSVKALLTGRMR